VVKPLIERIRVAADGGGGFLPVHAHFGVRAIAAEPGRTELAQSMGGYCLDRHGQLSPGAFLVGADAALGSAIASQLDYAGSVISLTLSVQFVRLSPGGASEFRLTGRATHVSETSGFAMGEIVDDTGALVAYMSTHCAVIPLTGQSPRPQAHVPDDGLYDIGDDGSGDLLAPLAAARAGSRLIAVDENEIRLVSTSTSAMNNSRGEVQGGVLALLGEQAVTACLLHRAPRLAEADAMDLTITFLRSVRPDSPEVEIVARAEHAGRRFAVARAVGRDSSGRPVISATGSRFRG
jgi:uncharacterized protein (TIGR00369 family)